MRGLSITKRFSGLSISRGKPLLPKDITTDGILLRACEDNDSKVQAFFDMHQKSFTFGQTNDVATQMAAGLLGLGLKQGDKVAILGPNQPEWYITKWACAKAGFPLVSINPLYTATELEYALNKVNVKCLICPKEIGPINYNRTIHQMVPNLDEMDRHNLHIPNIPDLKKIIYYSNTDSLPGVINWSDVEASADSRSLRALQQIKVRSDEIGNIQFTSGTTGLPKAAALTHFSMINNAIATVEHLNQLHEGFTDETVVLNVLPLYHIFSYLGGSLTGCWMKATNVFPSPGFSADAAILAAEKRKATILLGTPTMFLDIIASKIRKSHDISSLNYAVLGGSPVSPSLAMAARDKLGTNICCVYGMTETTGGSFLTPFCSTDDILFHTVGSPYPGIDAKIINEAGEIVKIGETGELCTKSEFIFSGYVNDEKKTKETFTEDGYLKSGDLAILLENGAMKIVGRSKDMIIRGGENIQPTEIEEFINLLEQVEDCYVIGVPNRRLQEEVAVYIKIKESYNISIQEITEYCKTGLARFKVPKYIKFITEFPKTTTGKVQKFKLQELALVDFPELIEELE